jgi:hypothetical protein
LHGVPKTTKSKCRKKVPKRVVFSYPWGPEFEFRRSKKREIV